MTSTEAARAILASIPGWTTRPANLTVLHGGLNHRTFRVESDGERYVLRIASQERVTGGGNRALEYSLQQQAAARGLAATVLFADASRGLVLMEYLQGDVLTPRQLASRSTLQQIGELLCELHAQPLCGVNFDPLAAAETYLDKLEPGRSSAAFARQCIEIVSNTPPPRERRCCHNDVVASNLIQGRSLQLLDFEYACDNEPMFDLASLIGWHNLAANESKLLLEAYAGEFTQELGARLSAQCRLFDALQWLWLAVRQCQQPENWKETQMAKVRKRLI
ncbi:MAG: phosphotransferase family protein [Woeseia sp.]|nr:phosphotransferase family protein [Woeseia sp.]MBT8096672.1 phosphotransferase family protein [Woeseia sp.]NNE61192.1 phosphotransferase family protein [Woeseia sp.]NNL55745.1 phosphotransferase family protein [Woeseia sp.]